MQFDILIVGAGPTGLSLALSLTRGESPLNVGLIERQSEAALASPVFDGRDIALTHRSKAILESLDVWPKFPEGSISKIRAAKVENGNSNYCLDFDPQTDQLEALGYLVSNHEIRKALYDACQPKDQITILNGRSVVDVACCSEKAEVWLDDGEQLSAGLLVAADSRFSETRRMFGISAAMHDFGRVCIVSRMSHEKAHEAVAYECFHYDRTLAVLPLSANESSIVVTAPMASKTDLMNFSAQAYAADVQSRFGGRYGEMKLVSERFAYPLVGVHANRFIGERAVLIGDAAVGMHPVTAHGFNLGLSGQEILARLICAAQAESKDIANLKVQRRILRRFERQHMLETRPMYHGTNQMVRLFTSNDMPSKALRYVGLRMANKLPPFKQAIRNKLTQASVPRLLQRF